MTGPSRLASFFFSEVAFSRFDSAPGPNVGKICWNTVILPPVGDANLTAAYKKQMLVDRLNPGNS